MQLAEVFQIFDAEIVAGQVQQGVDQHGAVTVGKNEAVAVEPLRIGRVVFHVAVPQYLGDVRHTHWGARVAGIRLLHRVHAQSTDGVC